MIRMFLAVFALAIGVWVFIVPDQKPDAARQSDTEVTRAITPDLAVQSTQVAFAPSTSAPVAKVRTHDRTMAQTTATILAGIGLVDAPLGVQSDSEQSSNSFIVNASAVTDAAQQSLSTSSTALEALLITALLDRKSDTEIDRLVNAAAIEKGLAVPAVLVTSDGRVDTAVLLDALVEKARVARGGVARVAPELPTGSTAGFEVRVVQRADRTTQYRFYTVNAGDSLGAIAVKFYGDVAKYFLIFEVNRAILSSPDLIKTGQRLAIPDLPKL